MIWLIKVILLTNLLFLFMRGLSLIWQKTKRTNLLHLERWVVQLWMPKMDQSAYSQIILMIRLWYTEHRILQFGDASDFVVKFMELGNIHKSKEGIFEMTSDNGGRLETLYWSNLLSKKIVPFFSDFVLIDGTHKTTYIWFVIGCNHCGWFVGKIYSTWISASTFWTIWFSN